MRRGEGGRGPGRAGSAVLGALMLLGAGGCVAMDLLPRGRGVQNFDDPTVEVSRVASSDGVEVETRLYPAEVDRPAREGEAREGERLEPGLARSLVLFCHGVNDNNTSAMASFFSGAGFRVMKFDYRGFGHSTGARATSRGFLDDTMAVYARARGRDDVDASRIVFYGHSMGGLYALAGAAEARRLGHSVPCVVIANTFSSWRAAAHEFVPIAGFLLGGADGLDPEQWITRLGDTPVLIVHTGDDTIMGPGHAWRLYTRARQAGVPATLLIHPHGGHAWPFWDETALERQVVAFVRWHVDPDRPASRREELLRLSTPREEAGERSPVSGEPGADGTPASAAPGR